MQRFAYDLYILVKLIVRLLLRWLRFTTLDRSYALVHVWEATTGQERHWSGKTINELEGI